MKLLICTLLFLIITNVTSHDVYIVYMGGKGTSKSGSLREDQARLMYSLQNRTAVVHVYKHGFTGFAVHASEEEAKLLAAEPGVLSVFPDKTVPLHTTRSWTFLEHQHDSLSATSHSGSTANGSDIIIGVIDSGANLPAHCSHIFFCLDYPKKYVLSILLGGFQVFGQNLRALQTKVWVQFRNDGEELVKKRRISLLLAAIGTCILCIMYSL